MTRVEKWLVGILALLALVIGGTLLLLWLQPDPTAIPSGPVPPAPTAAFGGETAMRAYAAAQQAVAPWQADAQLVSATATWPRGTQPDALRPGRSTWGFTFYSPSAGATAVVAVVDGAAQLVESGPAVLDAPLLNVTGWQVDSDTALDQFLAAGGTEFLQQNGITTVTLTLDLQDVDGRVAWIAAAVGSGNGRGFTTRIDATSSDILEQP